MPQLVLNIQKAFPPSGESPGFTLDVRLDCEPGVTVLFGSSGSGKTLTLDCLAGFLLPDHGRILLHDRILFDSQSHVSVPPQRRGIGYVFQNYALFPHMSVEQNLAFGIAETPALDRHRRIREMLDVFGLTPHAQRFPQELSGGEKQRASIARALIRQPRLLLLDEPVRGLDYQLRHDFYAVVRNIRHTYNIPILLVTHDVTEGFVLADSMAVYRAGRVVQTGAPDEVFLHPRNAAVARLLGITNIFSGTLDELDPMSDTALIQTGFFPVRVPYLPGRLRGDKVWFCIPGEHVALSAAGASDRVRDNQVPVKIVEEIPTPSTIRLLLKVQHGSNSNGSATQIETEISRTTYTKLGVATHKEWMAALPKAFIHVFPEQGE